MANREEIKRFLDSWKLACGTFIDFIPRQKNIDGIRKLNLTKRQAMEILHSLAVENYVSGPEMDKDKGTRDIWIFGYKLEGIDIYIKIKIFHFENQERAKCLSFHPAEIPLRYPFSGGS